MDNNNPNDTSFNSSFTNSNNGSYKQHSNGLEIDPFMYNNDPQQIDINNEYNENMKKRKQDEEFMGNINKKTKSEINNENITISENPFNDDMQDDIDLGTKAPENITIIENEEETRKKKEKNEQLKQQKLILLKKKKECLDQEIELLDKILSKYPKVERKVVPPITPTTSIPPIKTVTKPVKKKAAEKKVVKKETKVVKKEPKVKPEAPEKKKPKKEVAVKKETPKKEVKKEAPKKEVKKEAPKKEVKKEVKKEQTAVKKEVKKKEEVAKKEPKKEAPKKTASSKQKSKTKKFERCRNILDALMNDKLAVAFNIPVDYVYFNIPDYPKKIKEPMDFGTIKKTLESDKYSEVSEFVSDIELVFDNCWKYNGVNSEIGGYATHLSESFKTLSAGIEDEDDDDFTPVDKKKKAAPKKKPGAPTTAVKKTPTIKKKEEKVAPTPTPTKSSRRRSLTKSTISEDVTPQTVEMEKTIFSLNEKLSELQNQMEKMKKSQEINQKKEKKEKPTSPKKKPKSTPKTAPKKTPVTIKKEDARPMTFKEKHDLSLQINNLDGDSLGEVVKIISERMPELANNTAPDEIEIDIDALDAITLRCLERFVKSCNTKKKRSTKKPRESPENITIEDKQLLVIEAAHSTSSSIRELERELATMEGRPVPPPIDVPLALPVKKNQKKKNIDPNDIFMNDENSISDSDFMSSEDENDELQIVPTNNPSSVSFDSGFMHNSSQYLSSTLSTPISNNNVSNNNSNSNNNNGKKDGVVIKNIASWNLGDDNTSVNTDSNSNQPFDKSGELWKKLQNRETINKQKEKERELQEVKIRQEKERQEREKREKLELIDKEKREKERMLLEEQEKERLEHESKREQERLRAIQELELSEKTVDLHDNHDMIESFEKSLYN